MAAATGKTFYNLLTGPWTDINTKDAKLTVKKLAEILNLRLRTKSIGICDDCGGGDGNVTQGEGGTPGIIWDHNPDFITGLTDGDTSGSCPDTTGNGHQTIQADNTKWPIWRDGALNGYAVLEFAPDDYLLSDYVGIPTNGMTMFVVARHSGAAVEHGTILRLTNDAIALFADQNRLSHYGGGAPHCMIWHTVAAGGDIILNPPGRPSEARDYLIFALRWNGPLSADAWSNGIDQGNFDPHADGDAHVQVMQGSGGNCQIARDYGFGFSLSDTEVFNEINAIARKYNLNFVGTVLTVPAAIANVETMVLTQVLQKNTANYGTTLRFWGWLKRAGVNVAQPTYRIRVGTVTLTGNIAGTLAGVASAVAGDRMIRGELTIQSIGAGGTVIASLEEVQDQVAPTIAVPAATVAIDTTVDNLIEITFDSGNAANTYTWQMGGIDLVRR